MTSTLDRGRRTAVLAAASALLATLLAAPTAASASDAHVAVQTYGENEAVIANPARGFYSHTETHSYADGSGWEPLDAPTLEGYRDEGVSQILRVVYLERYVDADLDAPVLDAIAADLATARTAGVSVILRFAYVQGGDWPYSPPYGDATLERVLGHIEQLTPLLRQNADVIAVLQEGFIGLWGEGYYTDHFVTDPADPGVVTDADWDKRNAVVDALAEALPPSRSLQVRTMLTKQRAFDRPSGAEGALGAADAYSGSPISRVGHHNDCFLASPDDFGTFLSDPLSLDQEYLAAETRFVPMGGETCTVNPPRSEWASASAELARYHYSYLNRGYNQDVLNSWGADNLDEVAKRLGYRFVLEQSRATSGAQPSLEIDVRNEGWAAPYNARPVEVVLEGASETVRVPLGVDARTIEPGESITLRVPFDEVPAGRYDAYLALPAPEDAVAADPRFAIQTANVDTWDAERGWNDLQQEVVVGEAPGALAAPFLRGGPRTATIGWTPPQEGGTPTSYVVTLTSASGATQTVEVAAPACSVTVRDLHPGRWSATVEARNASGTSPVSPASPRVTVRGGPPSHGWW